MFAKLKFSPALFKKIPSFACFVFENIRILILKIEKQAAGYG